VITLKTPLYESHKKLNAKIVPFGGFEMPLQYSTIKEEVEAVRKAVGIFDVSHMGEFIVEGPQAIEFVDYMITNDLASLPNMKAVYSCIVDETGGVIDDLICYKINNLKVLICVNASNIDKDFNWFKKHAHNFDCSLKNESDNFGLLAVQGPDALSKIQAILKINNLNNVPSFGIIEEKIDGKSVIIARTGYTGEDGVEIFCHSNQVVTLWDKLLQGGCKPCGLAARDSLRLEAGFPLYGHELLQEWTPLDASLKWTIKLKKKNFMGKLFLEQYHPRLTLIKFFCEKGIPRENYEIQNELGKKIGKTTSGGHSFTIGKGIGMALIDAKSDLSKELYIDIRGQKSPITITKKLLP
jgi:aminomethyltransferase